MRFSLNFLKEFIDLSMPIDQLVRVLTMAGMEVEGVEQIDDDWVLDIEITTNRYDWLSAFGVAREVAACADLKFCPQIPKLAADLAYRDRSVNLENTQDCYWYMGRMIKNVSIKNSLPWLVQRVSNCGINSINNVVDITNYCMIKWGNPLHAFDADKLEGDIYVRRARLNEKFIGIDNKERLLTKDNLVIADEKKVVALAGVMGAKNSEVDFNTKNIFLEAAIFSPYVVRLSRRACGLDTDSSYRFERMVCPDTLEYALNQAVGLITELSSGLDSGYIQAGAKPVKNPTVIEINSAKLAQFIGKEIPLENVKNIMERLGCLAKIVSDSQMQITASSFRYDLKEPVDIYEEISRIYGFENIPAVLPFLSGSNLKDKIYETKKSLGAFLAGLGLREIITYSIEEDDELKKLGFNDFIRLQNPLRKQENVMRPSLLIGAIKAVRHNLNRGQTGLKFFECANIYNLNDGQIKESSAVCLCAQGKLDNLYYLINTVKKISSWGNIICEFNETSLPNFTNALKITSADHDLGFVGKLDCAAAEKFELKDNFYFCQLDLSQLAQLKTLNLYREFSLYPAVCRDISLIIADSAKFLSLEQTIKSVAKGLLQDLAIVDQYQAKDLAKGSKALTIRLSYQVFDRTLTSQEVDQLHTQIREKLSQLPGIILR